MKIKELIAELQKLDPERMVVVAGYEGGYSEVKNVKELPLRLNVHEECHYGEHDFCYGHHVPDAIAIHISAN